MMQFPFAFEFNTSFLIAILDASFSCQYGTFLANEKEKKLLDIPSKTTSLWTHLLSDRLPYLNNLYFSQGNLRASALPKDLLFWDDFYLRGWDSKAPCTIGRSHFTKCAEALLQTKDDRIAELEKQLQKYKPNLVRQSSKQIVSSILEEIVSVSIR